MPHIEPSATCPQCEESQTGYSKVNQAFGFRKIKPGNAYPVPQSWCRACRASERKDAYQQKLQYRILGVEDGWSIFGPHDLEIYCGDSLSEAEWNLEQLKTHIEIITGEQNK